MTLSERLRAITLLDPAAWALEYGGSPVVWGRIASAVSGLQALLDVHGIGRDSLVGLLGRNRPGQVSACIGLLVGEQCLVFLNPLQPEQRLAEEVAGLNLPAIAAEEADWTPRLVEAARAAGTMGISIDPGTLLPRIHPDLPFRAGPFRTLPAGTAIEMQTSGTTGAPKRISLPRATVDSAMRDGVRGSGDAGTPTLKRSPALLFAPMVHASGTLALVLSLYEGRPIVLFDKFDIAEFRSALRRHRPRFASLPPTMIRMLLDSDVGAEEMSSLLAVRSGTAPLELGTHEAFEQRFGVPILINYGATEFMGAVSGWTLAEYKEFGPGKRGSVGRARRGAKLRVVDRDTGAEVPVGEMGVLEVDVGALGLQPGWTPTMDLARLDADGFLYIHGRADDAIIRGGFKVLGEEVVQALRRHPKVEDAFVAGVADARLGEVPVAAVEARSTADPPAEEELRAFAREHLAPYKVPVRFLVVPELPRTISYKVDRRAARALFDA